MKTKFTNFLLYGGMIVFLFLIIAPKTFSQAVPEYMYFKFDATGNQQNYASAPVGNNPATLTGLTIGGTGQFGTAMIGDNVYLDGLNTGWATNLPAAGWTISMWLNNMPSNTNLNYLFGDVNAAAFRCFIGGAAGAGNVFLRRTGWTDVLVTGVAPGPIVLTFVYTGSAINYYKNGVPAGTVAETNAAVTGTGPFYVGTYNAAGYGGIPADGLMDEFRMYNRALSDAEVLLTWNQPLPIILAGPPIVVTLGATAVTTTTATLNGTVNANGDNTTVSFEYGLTTAYGTTVPGVPATVTGTTVIPVLANITGLLPGNTYHFRVKGVNSYGTTNGNDMAFTTPPILPVVVTTAATGVGSTIATLNGTVNAGGASTTVTFEYGLSTAYGTTVPGVPGTVTGNTVTPVSANITGLTLNTTYHFRIKGVNSVGTSNGNDMMFTTTLCPVPNPAGVITGPTIVCGNSSGNVYSVAAIPGATGYTWTVPAGAVITSGTNTTSITVTFGNSSGNVSVVGTNTCGNGTGSNLAVTVNIAPVPTITGYTSMCVNIGPLNYVTESGMTNYIWTVSPGNTITGGQGTNLVQISWTVPGTQWVKVTYTGANGCSAGAPTQLNVTVQPLPGPAGTITGTAAVCGGANGIAYSVGTITNAVSYVWSLPPGATIATGAGTNSITVNFDPFASSGNITVYGNNTCGNGTSSPPFAVNVTPLPDIAGVITGETAVCQGVSGIIYSVAPIANATGYVWTVLAGATIVAGANTNSITVDFSLTAVSGIITVYGTNSCGNGAVGPEFEVTVNLIPPAPIITVIDEILLHSDAPLGNQWYLEGAPIPGATQQDYTAEQSGEYWCVVILNGCSSEQSNHIFVTMTGTGPLQSAGFTLYPVPNDGRFKVSMTSPTQEIFTIQVFNIFSVMITEINGIEVKGTVEKVIDLRPVTDGIYTVVIRNSSVRIVKKILVNK